MKLRLLLTDKCPRDCQYCNNKYWDLKELPVAEENFKNYSEVLITGGEPMLFPEKILNTCSKIRSTSEAKIYLYTAKIDNIIEIIRILWFVDGMSITLHEDDDLLRFISLNIILSDAPSALKNKSLKLNLFEDYGFNLIEDHYPLWRFKNKTWIKHKHLPEGEVFKRLK